MKNIILLSSLSIVLLMSACQKKYKCNSYNSEYVSETISVNNFEKIALEMEADIYYVQGDEQSVIIEAPEKLLELISVSVFQNTLEIDSKHNFCFTNSKKVIFYITTPELNEIDIQGSGNFKVENYFETPSLDIKISGSGDFYADSISTSNLTTSISGSGDIYAAGVDTIQNQNIKISGSGDVNFYDIPALKTKINISGSGNCRVYTIDELDVKISGSGDVRYIGQPAVSSNITGSGSVKQH